MPCIQMEITAELSQGSDANRRISLPHGIERRPRPVRVRLEEVASTASAPVSPMGRHRGGIEGNGIDERAGINHST